MTSRIVAVIAIAFALACGGTSQQPPGAGTPDAGDPDAGATTALITGAGTPVGVPASRSMDGDAGTAIEPLTGASVRAAAGTFSGSASLTVQAITNPLESGSGMGVEVSVDQDLLHPLIVNLPYDANEADPDSLRLAARASDGTWRALYPMRLDKTARTLEAALPAGAQVPSTALTSLRAATAAPRLNLANVIAFHDCLMTPEAASMKPSATKDFTPECWVDELAEVSCQQTCDAGAPDSCFNTFCYDKVTNKYPLTNQKSGFTRDWAVEAAGTISPHGQVGATYTAPGSLPPNNPVLVYLRSTNVATGKSVQPLAKAYIQPDHFHVTASVTTGRTPICGVVAAASVTDGFSFDFTGQGSNVSSNIQNHAPAIGAMMCADDGSPPVSIGAYDYVEMSRADEDDVLDINAGSVTHGVTVWVTQSQEVACQCAHVSDPGQGPSPIFPGLSFEFSDDDFLHGSTVQLPDINQGDLIWKVTVEQQ